MWYSPKALLRSGNMTTSLWQSPLQTSQETKAVRRFLPRQTSFSWCCHIPKMVSTMLLILIKHRTTKIKVIAHLIQTQILIWQCKKIQVHTVWPGNERMVSLDDWQCVWDNNFFISSQGHYISHLHVSEKRVFPVPLLLSGSFYCYRYLSLCWWHRLFVKSYHDYTETDFIGQTFLTANFRKSNTTLTNTTLSWHKITSLVHRTETQISKLYFDWLQTPKLNLQ